LRRCLSASFVVAALFFAACTPFFAQNAPTEADAVQGSLAGRLTDLNSAPLAGVAVVLRNVATGAETRSTTTRNGSYHFAALDAGEYTLAAESAQFGRGQLEGVIISGGHEARVQAAIDFEPETKSAPALATNAGPAQPRETPVEARAVEPKKMAPAPVAEALKASTPVTVSSASVAAKPAPEPLHQPAPSAPVQFAAVEPVRLKQPAVEVVMLETERPAPSTVETASVAAPAAIPARIASTPAHDVSTALSASLSTNVSGNASGASGVQPMVNARPLQLLPIAAAIARVDPVLPVLQTTVSDSEVAALPTAGRNWQNFALETPTASESAGSSQPAYRGEDQEPAEITIDGAPTRLAFGAAADTTPSNPDSGTHSATGAIGQAWNGGRGFSVSEAGVREVETVAGNLESEEARGTGGRIALKTAHGENQIHGQAFLSDKQNTWGARNPFTQWLQNTGMAPTPGQTPIIPFEPVFSPIPFTPPDHETAWGLGMGGSIRRDKLFWFAALDSYHRNDPGLSVAKNTIGTYIDPTTGNESCIGLFCQPSDSQVQLLSAQLGESLGQADSDYNGMPGSGYAAAGLEQLASLHGPAPRSAAQWVGFGRIDWQVAERHRITLEGIGASWNAPGGGLTRLSENYGNHSYGSSEASEQWLLARWEAYLTPNLLTTTQASAGRDILTAKPDAPSAFEQTLLSVNAFGQLPQIVVDSRYGFTIGNPSRFGQGSYPDEKLLHAQELVDWVHNNLLLKAGIEVDHNADATSLLRNQTGTYYYSKVEDFISDALVFEKFGFADALDPANPHNCGATDATFGSQPCYSYYSQMMGPTHWHLSTSDFAGFATAQWQPAKQAVVSFGLRWEREKLPPPIGALANAELTAPTQANSTPPLRENLPDLGNNWGPRISFAIGNGDSRWPVLRLGYGTYYGRTENATVETVLTQTGSLKGDLSFFMRPQDDCQYCSGGSPPFPYVFQGLPASVVKPGVVGFGSRFRNPEVHQAVVSMEEALPSHIQVTAAAIASLGRRLPMSIDTNLEHPTATQTITYGVVDGTGAGPIKTSQVTVPFYASWPYADCVGNPHADPVTGQCGRLNPDYQQITQIMSRANSTYEAAMIKVSRYGRRGLSLHAHYTYSHAMDWNPNETTLVAGSDVLDPADFSQEYGVSDLDVRHSAAAMAIYETPWKAKNLAGVLSNGWMLSSIGQFRSGSPYTMRTSGSLPELVDQATGATISGLGPGMNGSGGDNRVYGVGRNTYRYPLTWKADMRLAKRFDLGHMRDLELMAESFNLFNHQNVTELETTGYYLEPGSESLPPTLNFLTGLKANSTAFGQPLSINGSDLLRERQIQLGLRMRF
jgi:hypothetical protein